MTRTPSPRRGHDGWRLKRFSASERRLRIRDCAQITDCHWIRSSTGLPECGLFSDLGRFVSGH
eukprot:4839584-Alexandrium_andersonii.AAC.1